MAKSDTRIIRLNSFEFLTEEAGKLCRSPEMMEGPLPSKHDLGLHL
jgi:hypothetical protein